VDRFFRGEDRNEIGTIPVNLTTLSYSETFKDHLEHPRNAGELPEANAVAEQSNPVCGDRLRLSLLIRKYIGRIFCSHLRFDLIGDTRGTERFIVTEMKAKIT